MFLTLVGYDQSKTNNPNYCCPRDTAKNKTPNNNQQVHLKGVVHKNKLKKRVRKRNFLHCPFKIAYKSKDLTESPKQDFECSAD